MELVPVRDTPATRISIFWGISARGWLSWDGREWDFAQTECESKSLEFFDLSQSAAVVE